MGRVLVVLAVAMGLSGCASEPVAKPYLTQEGYTGFILRFSGNERCVQLGYLDPALGAYGNNYQRILLTNYVYDANVLQAGIDRKSVV